MHEEIFSSKQGKTYEMTKRMGKHYEINYCWRTNPDYTQDFYFQVERIKDGAILYANKQQENCFKYCWKNDIKYSDVAIY